MSETTTAIVEGAVVIIAIVMGVRLGGSGWACGARPAPPS